MLTKWWGEQTCLITPQRHKDSQRDRTWKDDAGKKVKKKSLAGFLLIPAALRCILVVVSWNYPCTNTLFLGSFFFFFARFRKINVYEPNTIHHRLKAEVIQEMIAGKIGFSLWGERERERVGGRQKEREGRKRERSWESLATWVIMDSGSLNNVPMSAFGI